MRRHHVRSSPLPWAAAASLAATGGIHIALAPAHLHEAPYAGALFIALSAAALTIGFALLGSNHRLIWLAAASLSITALLAYAVSRSVGLPALGDDVGDWLNPLGVAAIVCEVATVLICACHYAGTASFASLANLRSS